MPQLDLATLIVRIKSDSSQYSSGMKQAQTQTKSFGLDVEKVLGGAVVGAFTAAAAAAIKFANESVKEFQSFDTKIREVYTLLPGISEEAMGQLQADALNAGREMGRLPDETIPALYQALSAGVPQDNVFDFLETANQAALGGVTTLETAVDGISSVVNAYGADIISAGEASDQMFAAVRGGKTTFEELAKSLFNVIPTASSLGLEFGNVTAALATMTAAGVPTSVATTQLRQLLIELSQAGGDASDTFQEMAGQTFVDFVASGGNLQQALQYMEQAAADSGVRLSDMFSSVEAGNAALSLTGASTDKFTTELNNAATAAGGTQDAADMFSDSLQRTEDRANAAEAQYKVLIGEGLSPLKAAYLALKLAVLEGAIENHDESIRVRELTEAHGSAIDVLYETARATESLSTRRSEMIDVEEGVAEAIEEINRLYPNLNDNQAEAEANTAALNAATMLLNQGFQGTGAELAAAVAEYINNAQAQSELRDKIIATSEAYDSWTVSATTAAEVAQQTIQPTFSETILTMATYATNVDKVAGAMENEALGGSRFTEAQERIGQANEMLNQYQATIGGYFMDALTGAADGETNWNNELFKTANQLGLTATQTTLLAMSTGEYTQDAINAALETAAMREKIDQLALAIANEDMTVGQALIELDNFKNNLGNTATASDTLGASIDTTTAKLEALEGGYVVTIDGNTGQIDSKLSSLEARLSQLGSGGQQGFASGGYQAGPDVGNNAMGTDYWQGGLTWVGEQGPEIIDLPAGSTVYSNDESMAMMGNQYEINVDARGSNLTEKQITAAVELALQRTSRESDFVKRMGG